MPSGSSSRSRRSSSRQPTLQVQAANLQTQAANLQTQAAKLQTQQVKLKGQQQTAQGQQQQAEQLKTELTNELTKAGGDPRGTDPQTREPPGRARRDRKASRSSRHRGINKPGDAATFTVIATTAPASTATADLVKTVRTYTIPQAIQGTNLQAFVGGADGELRRPRRRDLGQAAASSSPS